MRHCVCVAVCVAAGMDARDPSFLPRAREVFVSSAADDAAITATVAAYERSRRYVLCPHTAAGVYGALHAGTPGVPIVSMATAHPGKFGDTVETRVDASGAPLAPAVPECLAGLLHLPRRCAHLPNDPAAVAAFIDAAPL